MIKVEVILLMVAKYGTKPPRPKCEDVARQLILKHPFMRDDQGIGYVSAANNTVDPLIIYLYRHHGCPKLLSVLITGLGSRGRSVLELTLARTRKGRELVSLKINYYAGIRVTLAYLYTCSYNYDRYPVKIEAELDDSTSFDQHVKALSTEMENIKPETIIILLPLMKRTFSNRRMYMQHDATSVKETLSIYPTLSRVAVVCYTVSI